MESWSSPPSSHPLYQPHHQHHPVKYNHQKLHALCGGSSAASDASWRSCLDLNLSATLTHDHHQELPQGLNKSISAGRSCISPAGDGVAYSSKRPAPIPIPALFQEVMGKPAKKPLIVAVPLAVSPFQWSLGGPRADENATTVTVASTQPQQLAAPGSATPPETRACSSDCDSSSSVILNSETEFVATPQTDAKPALRRNSPFLLDLNFPPGLDEQPPSAATDDFCLSRSRVEAFF